MAGVFGPGPPPGKYGSEKRYPPDPRRHCASISKTRHARESSNNAPQKSVPSHQVPMAEELGGARAAGAALVLAGVVLLGVAGGLGVAALVSAHAIRCVPSKARCVASIDEDSHAVTWACRAAACERVGKGTSFASAVAVDVASVRAGDPCSPLCSLARATQLAEAQCVLAVTCIFGAVWTACGCWCCGACGALARRPTHSRARGVAPGSAHESMRDSMRDSDECVICMEPVTTSAEARLACGHGHFHKSCLVVWFARTPACPICRRPAPACV